MTKGIAGYRPSSFFTRGASAATALAFQIASTNLVWELGLILWVLIGWRFTLAELLGGIVMIALVGLTLRLARPRELEARARARAEGQRGGPAQPEVRREKLARGRARVPAVSDGGAVCLREARASVSYHRARPASRPVWAAPRRAAFRPAVAWTRWGCAAADRRRVPAPACPTAPACLGVPVPVAWARPAVALPEA